jgi:hypothetical protein
MEQLRRIGQVELYDPGHYVVSQMLPVVDVKQLMDRLPEPIALNKGQTWTQSLGLLTDASKAPQKRPHRKNCCR